MLKCKISSPMFLCPPPPIPSPSSSPPSHGLRELLAIWMLALYCEHSLIASALPTVSQASQHGAPAVCLICHCSVVIHCKKKEKNRMKRMIDRGKEREGGRESIYKGAAHASSSLQSHHLFSAPLLLGSLFFSQPETINGVLNHYFLSCLKIVLFCLFSVGDAPFTAPLLLYLSGILTHVSPRPPSLSSLGQSVAQKYGTLMDSNQLINNL